MIQYQVVPVNGLRVMLLGVISHNGLNPIKCVPISIGLELAIGHLFIVFKGKSRYLRHLFCKGIYTWGSDYYCVVVCTEVVTGEVNRCNKELRLTAVFQVLITNC